ncbi:MAG: S-layer homology domain-containing protein, partial [Oscillospiraceae bacterium]|nr:S-layer homology domain-containing protein [Oscillospiraceae bacterium]
MKMFRKILSVILAFVICFAVVGGGVAVAGVEDMTMISLKINYSPDESLPGNEQFTTSNAILDFLKSIGDIDITLQSESGEITSMVIREYVGEDLSTGNYKSANYLHWQSEDPIRESRGQDFFLKTDEFAPIYAFGSNVEAGVKYSIISLPMPPNYKLSDSEVITTYSSYDVILISMKAYLSPLSDASNASDGQSEDVPTEGEQPTDNSPPDSHIPDDQPATWAAERVNRAIDEGIIPESFQGRYTQPTTRAEFCALAVALFEKVRFTIEGRKSFEDTNDENIEKMAYIGVVGGTNAEGTLFNPSGEITRAAAATLLTNLAKAVGKPLPIQAASFNDNAS